MNYTKNWAEVEKSLKEGLPKTALKKVNDIFTAAKKEKNDGQLIKSILYLSSLKNEYRNDPQIGSIQELDSFITLSKEPLKSVLKNYQANAYWSYFQNNRWTLYNRTATSSDFKKADIKTWSSDDFIKIISNLFLESIQEKNILQNTNIEIFRPIISKGNAAKLRPTLYDMLVHKANDFFKTPERSLKKPVYAFTLNQKEAFDDAAAFSKFHFISKDSNSLELKTLENYQSLIDFHLKQKNMEALIDIDIDRIEYAYQLSIRKDKNELYKTALQNLMQKYSQFPESDKAAYLLASWYENNANSKNNYKKTAKEILDKVIALKNNSEGNTFANNLLVEILAPELNFQVENVNIPGQPFRVLVKYKNLDKIFLRIVKVTPEVKEQIEKREYREDQNFLKFITQQKAYKNWEQALPNPQDYENHSSEIKIDALETGQYYILASLQPEFDLNNNILASQLNHVSNLAYILDENNLFVVDRTTGKPLPDVKVNLFEKKYNDSKRKYDSHLKNTITTNARGMARISFNKNNNYLKISLNYKNDILDLNNDIYLYKYDAYNKKQEDINTFFFTDRSIYRPGQTVYFKGIMIQSSDTKKENKILTGTSSEIKLTNPNGDIVKTITVKTNEYGTFSGSFTLPLHQLNGRFSITDAKNQGNTHFSVEEYKRPKFEVKLDQLTKSFKLNDLINATGFAKAYAGNPINDAKVVYRVVREQRPLYPWRYFRMYFEPNEVEIIHGETKTDADGKFSVQYTAIPDSTQNNFEATVYDYTIYVDVTDINGETRSAQIIQSVSQELLVINSQKINEIIDIKNINKLPISTETINGSPIPSTLKIEFKKLDVENRLLRSRYWKQADQFVMSKSEYIKYFPFDIYNNEDNPETWKQLQTVHTTTVNTDSSGFVAINPENIVPGAYAILLSTKDKNGKEIKDTRFVFIQKGNQNIRPTFFSVEKPTAKNPGETALVWINSQVEKPYIISKSSKDTIYNTTALNVQKNSFSYAVSEKDRGGFGTSYFMVYQNRFFQDNVTIAVPWTNKDLSIEYGSYRNKLLPGATDTWHVTIKGNKKDKVAAEMLASMYDASLDQFAPHQWRKPNIWHNYYQYTRWNTYQNFTAHNAQGYNFLHYDYKNFDKRYNQFLDLSYNHINEYNIPVAAGYSMMQKKSLVGSIAKIEADAPLYDKSNESNPIVPIEKKSEDIQVRKNLQETAFFFPDLKTDKEGNISFTFTMPEALTKWKLQTFAHTKDLAFGIGQAEIITQKELMVQPNIPRFLREGDQLSIPAKVVNLTTHEITGIAQLQLIDAETGEVIDGWFKNTLPQQYFTIKAAGSENIAFPIEVPYQFSKAITWRITAKTTKGTSVLSDGEENTLPVLTNSMLVTESLPISVKGSETKQFNFEKLLQSGQSETLQQHKITVEYTTNPAWYAVQALPYMMEYPYDCAEQTWNRYYANSLASKITESAPKVKKIFDTWKNIDTAALTSNLEKNQELKSVLLEETPWVLNAKNENQQKKNIALLFDLNKMSSEQNKAIDKLIDLQLPNGGFSWFKGGNDDVYMTQYIVTGIGHLKQLNAISNNQNQLDLISRKAITYLDMRIKESYDLLLKNKVKIENYTPSYYELQYLYMRSFYKNIPIFKGSETAVKFFTDRATATWTTNNKYMQSMLALALHRNGDKVTPGKILQSLKEYAIVDPEMGMYFKDANSSWWWYEAPIERQAMIIEAFNEISKDNKTVDDLKTWLLKNKQTTHWNSTKATAEACYALLLEGSEWINDAPTVTIQLGKKQINSSDVKTEAGTGYFKESIDASQITPSMGNIKVSVKSTNKSNLPSWGAVYWQYFEQLDKISFAATPLQIKKNLFITKNTDRGPILELIKENDVIKVGDKITVRIEIKTDRDMEYVHMKDMRASSFEPTNVLSSYKWQGGLGYYETTKDASTNFFFSYLRKGTYVFEYTLFASTAGNFSNGVTTIQCMYAPEFTAHSEGVRVNVE